MSDLPDVLREYRVKIIPAAVAKAQRDYVEDLGLRTKFGGTPDAIQSGDDFPGECVECGGKLHFVAQLDSFEFKSEDNPNRKDYGDAQFMAGCQPAMKDGHRILDQAQRRRDRRYS